MKKLLPLITALFCVAGYGQQGNIVLDWTDNTRISYGESTVKVPTFKSDSYQYDNYNKSVSFAMKVPVSAAVSGNSLQITNISYESIQPGQLGDLSVAAPDFNQRHR